MPIHLRQICLVAEHLDPCVRDIKALLGVPVCHRDPGVASFGLENALFALSSQFLEVVAPTRSGTAAGRFLERKGGPGGYMVICQVPTLEEQTDVRARANECDVRVAYEADHGSWNIMQLHPRDMGAAFLEVDWDQQADMTGNWEPAGGMDWARSGPSAGAAISGVTLAGPDTEALAERWSQVIGQPASPVDGGLCLELANASVRFTGGRETAEHGLTAIDLAVPAPGEILERARSLDLATGEDWFRFCGVQFNLSQQW